MIGGSPHYKFDDLIAACKKGKAEAFVTGGAMSTALSDFNLGTMEAVLDFIATGGLEKLEFVNSKAWDNNPNPSQPVQVDAYHFCAGTTYGYMAFRKASVGKWIIKSFKKESSGDPRHLPFADALLGFQITKKEDE